MTLYGQTEWVVLTLLVATDTGSDAHMGKQKIN